MLSGSIVDEDIAGDVEETAGGADDDEDPKAS